MRFLLVSCALLGCASRYRTELVGTGTAHVVARGAADTTPAASIPLPRGSFDIAMRFDIPRAQVINWRVSCPGVEREGVVGETFEAYRERRLTDLRDMYRRDHQRAQLATRVVAGVVAPRLQARVVTPAGRVVVRHEVVPPPPPEPPPEAVIEPVIEPVIELPPHDTGRGSLSARVRIDTPAPGACSIVATADDTIHAAFSITRVRDLDREQAEHAAAIASGAIDARTRVTARLVATGADVDARQRRLAEVARARAAAAGEAARLQAAVEAKRGAELLAQREIELRVTADAEIRGRAESYAAAERIRLRLEAEAHARWQAEAPKRARIELIARRRTIATTHREYVIAWLVGECHADPNRRERIAETERVARSERERVIRIRIEAERAERERVAGIRRREVALRLQIEREERERVRAIAEARRAREATVRVELERARTTQALQVRTQISGFLVALGARIRPPRPEQRFDDPGAEPFPGARWTAGRWDWRGGAWIWLAGGWSDPHTFGDAGGEVVVARQPPPPPPGHTVVVVAPPPPPVPPILTIRVGAPPPVIIRHRPGPVVRDHRRPVRKKAEPKREPEPVGPKVRDYRR